MRLCKECAIMRGRERHDGGLTGGIGGGVGGVVGGGVGGSLGPGTGGGVKGSGVGRGGVAHRRHRWWSWGWHRTWHRRKVLVLAVESAAIH